MHLQVLERNTGACNLPTVQKGVQLQAVSNQLPSGSHGGEGQGHHLGHLLQEPGGEFTTFSLTSTACLTMTLLANNLRLLLLVSWKSLVAVCHSYTNNHVLQSKQNV